MILTVAQLRQRRALVRHAAAKRDTTALRQRSRPGAAPQASGVESTTRPPAPGAIFFPYDDLSGFERALREWLERP